MSTTPVTAADLLANKQILMNTLRTGEGNEKAIYRAVALIDARLAALGRHAS